MQTPRVLAVPQPWAWAVTAGIQRTISRNWENGTAFTGPVLIHALRKRFDIAGAQQLTTQGYDIPRGLPRGLIVGRAYLAYCVSTEFAKQVLSDMGHYGEGSWHLVLTDPEEAPHPIAAYPPSNQGLGVAPRGWKAAFEPSPAAS